MRSLRVGRVLVESVEDLLFALGNGVAVEHAHRRHSHRFRRRRRRVEQRRFQIARRRRNGAADRRQTATAAEISQRSSRVGSVERRAARDGGGTVHAGGGVGVLSIAAAASSFGAAGGRVEEVDCVGGGKETGCDAGSSGRGGDGNAFDSHHVDSQRGEVNLLTKKFVLRGLEQ